MVGDRYGRVVSLSIVAPWFRMFSQSGAVLTRLVLLDRSQSPHLYSFTHRSSLIETTMNPGFRSIAVPGCAISMMDFSIN